MLGATRADFARWIGGWGRYGAGRAPDQGAGRWAIGDAQSNGVLTSCHDRCNASVGLYRQDKRQGARPERIGQSFRGFVEFCEPFGIGQAGNMHNERVEIGSPLRFVNPRDRFSVGGIRAQPIDRLGRKGDQPARGDPRCSLTDASFVGS